MYLLFPCCHSLADTSPAAVSSETLCRWIRIIAVVCGLVPFLMTDVFAHGDLHEQIEAASRQIEQMPTAELYLKRGELYRAHREYPAALADFERAEALDTELDAVHLARGCTLLEAGNPADAEKALSAFLKRHPAHAVGYLYRARANVASKQFDNAVADYDQALRFTETPNPDHYLERARAQEGAGKLAEALNGLEQGITTLGALVTFETAALELEVKLEHYDAALARMDRLIAGVQRKERWQVRKASLLETLGRRVEAKQAYEEALASVLALPQRLRNIRATQEAEKRIREALAAFTPLDP